MSDKFEPTEKQLNKANDKIAVARLAREILSQGSSLMTTAEAVIKARAILARSL